MPPGSSPADAVSRAATAADAPALRTLLGLAYEQDPLMQWVFPDPADRAEAIAAWLGPYVDRYLPFSRGRVVDRSRAGLPPGPALAAGALWRWPDDDLRGSPLAATLPTPGGALIALVGRARAEQIGAAMAAERDARPSGPAAYLHFLAVDAAARRSGLGRHLVAEGVEAARRDGLAVVLETTNEENLAFYASVGLSTTAEVVLGDGPRLWVMSSGGRA